MNHIHTQPFWECDCEDSKEANRILRESLNQPTSEELLDTWFNRNFISGDRDKDELTIKFSGFDELVKLVRGEL